MEGAAPKDYYKSYFAVNDTGHMDVAKSRENCGSFVHLLSSTNQEYYTARVYLCKQLQPNELFVHQRDTGSVSRAAVYNVGLATGAFGLLMLPASSPFSRVRASSPAHPDEGE